jgi:hypothetical protein
MNVATMTVNDSGQTMLEIKFQKGIYADDVMIQWMVNHVRRGVEARAMGFDLPDSANCECNPQEGQKC